MGSNLHLEIDALLDGVAALAARVEDVVRAATRALLDGDVEAAAAVVAADDDIDAAYRAAEDRCVTLLATQAPVALDLRALLAVLRMVGELERAGDMAAQVAEAAQHRLLLPPAAADLLERMAVASRELLRLAAVAVRDREPEVAERLDLMDDGLDTLARSARDHLLAGAWGVDPALLVRLPMVVRCYERIGDHAVAVAERVEFLATGRAHGAHVGM